MRRLTPQLTGIREEVKDGRYCLVLEFSIKKDMTLEMWTDRQSKIQTFFGPGITAEIDSPSERSVHVYLTCDGRSVRHERELLSRFHAQISGVKSGDLRPPRLICERLIEEAVRLDFPGVIEIEKEKGGGGGGALKVANCYSAEVRSKKNSTDDCVKVVGWFTGEVLHWSISANRLLGSEVAYIFRVELQWSRQGRSSAEGRAATPGPWGQSQVTEELRFVLID